MDCEKSWCGYKYHNTMWCRSNYLDIAVYFEGQCNVAFEPISELKVPFIIRCYEDEVLN